MKPNPDTVEHERFLKAEIAEIERARWIESEKAHRDLSKDEEGRSTDTFCLHWVGDHAEEFRKKWDKSCCKTCQCYGCVSEPKESCDKHIDSLRIRIIKYQSKMLDFELINMATHEVIGRYYLMPTRDKNEMEPKILFHGVGRKLNFFNRIKKFFV
jgi:hypothetical protein